MKSSEGFLITLTWLKVGLRMSLFFLEIFPSLWSTPNFILPSERKWLFWKLPFKQQWCFFFSESCSCALQKQSMSAFSTLFLPFEVSVGQPLSLHRTLAFPWHFILFKALSLPLSYLILMTNRRGRQGRYLYPHFTDETSRAQRDGDLFQGDRIPQTLEDRMATSGSFYQVALPCPVGIWGAEMEKLG